MQQDSSSEKLDSPLNPTSIEDDTDDSLRATNLVVTRAAGDISGYIAAFYEELQQIGQISPQEFAEQFATEADYLPRISWDPTTAKFWDQFNLDPEENNRSPERENWRSADFRLTVEEFTVFKNNGFVVSERLGAQSFAELFYRIYSNDLPVFVSADALLHAWHKSYGEMLEELESSYFSDCLRKIIGGMARKLRGTWATYGSGVLSSGLLDADYFLAVARSLLVGKNIKTYLNQDARVTETLAAIEKQELQEIEIFGRTRRVDFSQFKVRGHYEKSQSLQQYFRTLMWCGTIDLRITGAPEESSLRELGGAIVLYNLLEQSGNFERWQQFDKMFQTFVGRVDSMTFAQLSDILDKANIKSPVEIKDWGVLEQLQSDIIANRLGIQGIRSHHYKSPPGEKKTQARRSFTVLGQRFVLDSWVISKVVTNEISWDGRRVLRRLPTSLDIAFAVLSNNQVVPNLVARMVDTNGVKFRDGLNYQHNLAALRNVIDQQDETVWEENIYMSWLATLRELSVPTTVSKYPEAMRTHAWAMKTVNTQLASWTQLRHDSILYAKQFYGMLICEYPAGFVEPRPEFWERFEKMVRLAIDLISQASIPNNFQYIQRHQANFLENFAQKLAILKEIAIKELCHQELTEEETEFLKNIVEIQKDYAGQIKYQGWYPGLFYSEREDSGKWDALIADVYTYPGEPECVLHQGVGNIDLMMIAVESGENKMVYAGPVLSHYEFEVTKVSRKSDSEWREDIRSGRLPARPDWTSNYLVPGENKDAKDYPRTEHQWGNLSYTKSELDYPVKGIVFDEL